MTAVFASGGKQYHVNEGDVVYLEKMDVKPGDTITFDEIIAVVDGENSKIGAPTVKGAKVTAKVIGQGKSKKIIIYKHNPKKGYHRKQGHRQPYTRIQVETITA